MTSGCYEQVPWRHESTGDTVYAKDPVEQVPDACTAPPASCTTSNERDAARC